MSLWTCNKIITIRIQIYFVHNLYYILCLKKSSLDFQSSVCTFQSFQTDGFRSGTMFASGTFQCADLYKITRRAATWKKQMCNLLPVPSSKDIHLGHTSTQSSAMKKTSSITKETQKHMLNTRFLKWPMLFGYRNEA